MAFAPARVDAVMLEARAATLVRRPHDDGSKRNALIAAGTLLEVDAAAGRPTPGTVRAACARARAPDLSSPAAVVVGLPFASLAVHALAASPVRIAVALSPGGDPTAAVAAGAHEVELGIDAGAVLAGRPAAAFDAIEAAKRACGEATLKVVIDAGELGSFAAFGRAAELALSAGADFLKTAAATRPDALPPLALLLCGVIRQHARRTGRRAGLALAATSLPADVRPGYLSIASETLGPDWLQPARLRIGSETA